MISKIGVSQKLIKKRFYRTSWIPSAFQTENKVKTIERAYAIRKNKEECLLFKKKEMKELKKKKKVTNSSTLD